jgi:hypothetical protein
MYDVYISKRQCMRDTGSDECQILLLLYWYQQNYLKHNICLTKTKIQLHILITCHLYAQCSWYVLIHPAMIYVSYLHVRQNSSIYTLVLHSVTTKFMIWLRKWCTASNDGGTIKVYILNREFF